MLTEYQVRARSHTIASSAINSFGLEAYAHLATGAGNFLFSPLSIHAALGLAYVGATGETAEQMATVLRWPEHERDEPPSAHINDENEAGAQLIVANAAWAQRGRSFLQSYIDRVTGPCRGEFRELDFIHSAEPARQTINEWVENKTSGKIQDLIPSGAINELTRLLLANAIYLNASWASEFDPLDTHEAPFHLAGGGRVPVQMMHQTAEFHAVDEERFAMVRLPHKGYTISMQVYVPHSMDDFYWLEKRLLATGPGHWHDESSRHDVVLSLPRFRMNCALGLKEALARMGMSKAFEPDADFSGITPPAARADEPGFFISDVLHKSFVEVDEVGTRAAAATAVILTGGGMPAPLPRLVVNADRPFMFTICANSPLYRSPTVLFMGKVMDPTAD